MRLTCLLFASLAVGCSLGGADSPVEHARRVTRAIDTFHDYEVARHASATNLAELEALHDLEPESEALMIALMRGWVLQTELFTLDDLEAAVVQGDESERLYHQQRVDTGFARAYLWGKEWLTIRGSSFDLSVPPGVLETRLRDEFTSKSDAVSLLWLGHALLGVHAGGALPDPTGGRAAELVLTRAVELDETAQFAAAHALLGRYYAARGDFDESRQHFARAEALAGGRYLLIQLSHATSYHCLRSDREAFQNLLEEILRANDPEPTVRLENASAKRRARRWSIPSPLWSRCGFAPPLRAQ